MNKLGIFERIILILFSNQNRLTDKAILKHKEFWGITYFNVCLAWPWFSFYLSFAVRYLRHSETPYTWYGYTNRRYTASTAQLSNETLRGYLRHGYSPIKMKNSYVPKFWRMPDVFHRKPFSKQWRYSIVYILRISMSISSLLPKVCIINLEYVDTTFYRKGMDLTVPEVTLRWLCCNI